MISAPRRSSLRALPFAATGLVLGWASCGGDVVVDGAPGGAGGTTASGGTAGAGGVGGTSPVSSSSGTFPDAGSDADMGCHPEAGPGETAQMACFVSGWCPPPDTFTARQQASDALHLCDLSKFSCCLEDVVDSVVCGPDESQGSCCYLVYVALHKCS